MLTGLLLAGAVAAGAHPIVVGIAAVAVVEPRLLIAGLIGWAIYHAVRRNRGTGAESEAAFLRALTAELKGGASLRVGLADAAADTPLELGHAARMARAGLPMDRIGSVLQRELPHNGVATAAAVELSAWSGARVANVFEGLAERASDAAELRREQRAATAQARLSALVVGLAPLVFTGVILAGGGMQALQEAGPAGQFVMGAGLLLEVVGLGVVALMMRSVGR